MHPTIRIICFLILTAFLSLGSFNVILVSAISVALLFFILPEVKLTTAWEILRRLRWLFLSLMIVYLWFTPGEQIIAGMTGSPTYEGLVSGALRVASLVLMVLAVSLVLQSTDNEDLIAAIMFLLYPLVFMGFPVERFAARLVLAMEKVTETHTILQTARSQQHGNGGYFSNAADLLANVFNQITQNAGQEKDRTLVIPDKATPPVLHWGYPVLFASLLWLVSI